MAKGKTGSAKRVAMAAKTGTPPLIQEEMPNPILDAMSFGFQLVTWSWFVKVWMWHGTAEAEKLPGATGFGWFFRYLTFYGFTLQTLTFTLCVAASCTRNKKNLASGHGKWVRDLADTLSSVAFGFANVVTIMFHLVRITKGREGAVEGGEIERPPWLGFTVHNLNSMVAWVHLFLSPHSFSPLAEKLSLILVLGYNSLILLCSYANGQFPYPFLNNLSFPW
eukprot:CAMPEP_0117673578 /NCGR_PEP_ID=MMETSP0804-20121206/14549_1 /TAXON_ID=1074897 /ORGANISM="Tetraselmis astigmatica, Strain CCMP880" /LENGTH=221 /DNA_ID=CAMNT_0005482329 /DNA_START=128 /DNA_END=790 /DNA_ORIENTATION=+